MYNGTTYLPADGIAKAFGKEFLWDGKNSSIYLGKKGQNQPDNWLDRLTYIGYKGVEGTLYKINGTVTDFAGDSYTDGILFKNYGWEDCIQTVDYPLNMGYSTLKGNIAAIKEVAIKGYTGNNETSAENIATIKIYGDGKLLYTSPDILNTMPANFEIPVKGVIKLTVEIKGAFYNRQKAIAITGLALYK